MRTQILNDAREKKDMEKKSIRATISTVLKALTLAMGVSVVVLSRLDALDARSAVSLLGIGLACSGACLLEQR